METRTKIPPVKNGIDFLSTSHFQIANDNRLITSEPFSYNTTSQKDYPLQKSSKVEPSIIPQPAQIMHKDKRLKEEQSINKEHFKHISLPERTFSKNSLSKTNFKMDFDNRVDSFQTTNKLYHYPMHADLIPPQRKSDPMKSFIPQGDKEKAVWPRSDYKDKFQQKELGTRNTTTNCALNNPSATIKGDIRSHGNLDMFSTTNRRELPFYSGHRKAVIPDHIHYPSTRIPAGKVVSSQSAQQVDFKFPPLRGETHEWEKRKIDISKSNYKFGDTRLTSFRTTMNDDYSSTSNYVKAAIAKVDMGKSSFPVGDDIAAAERKDTTLNRSHFKSPPTSFRNPLVDGSNLHTISKVDFGDERVDYESTMKSGFGFVTGKYEKVCDNKIMHSNFSLCQDVNNNTTKSLYTASYQPTYGVKRLVPNPVAIENLKKSYIGDAIRGLRELSTTQQESYTKKEITDREFVDTGRLHRSNIPIGSLCY